MRFVDQTFAIGREMEEMKWGKVFPLMLFEDGTLYIQAEHSNKTASGKARRKERNRERSTF